MVTTAFVTTDDGVALALSVIGSNNDAPTLLLVHGFGGAKEDFADHMEALGRHHRVVAFDLRGHGESEAPVEPSAYSLDRLGADVLAVADSLGLDRFRLLGHSMGGMVARRVVLARPERIDALVLMDTSAGPPPGIDPDLVRLGAEVAMSEGMTVLRRAPRGARPTGLSRAPSASSPNDRASASTGTTSGRRSRP